jgi:hypothetical protein
MTSAFGLPRRLIILAIVLPVAAFIGYLLASPDFGSFLLIGGFVGLLTLPIFLRWHHPILIFSLNLPVILAFLPGSPPFWMLAAIISLSLTVLGTTLDKEQRLLHAPGVTWSLLAIVLVVLFTMKVNGGIGLRTFGGASYGGKKYFFILLAIVAYFALSTRRIPLEKANRYMSLFVLSSLFTVLCNFAYMLGPGFWFVFYLLPTDWAVNQAMEDFSGSVVSARIGRISGMSVGSFAIFSWLLMRYGVRGLLDFTKPWRLLLLVAAVGIGLLGGFRSILVTYVVIFALQFFLEGLHRTRLLLVFILGSALMALALVPLSSKLPLSVQRCLTVLPYEVHPAVRMDAKGSTEWRWKMWQVLWPEIPKHLWIGKGYTTSAADHYLTFESARRGLAQDYEGSLVAGDYHNGPLSVIIPFGIWGVLAFGAFLFTGGRLLYRNYRDGPPALKLINTFLLASFVGRVLMFFSVFGAIHLDILTLASFVGMSVALNHGVSPVAQAVPAKEEARPSNLPRTSAARA